MNIVLFLLLLKTFWSPGDGAERVIFFVQPYMDESGWYTEPIVGLRDSTFYDVVNTSDTSFATYHAFSRKYFKSGLQYPVYMNDEALGEMLVIERDTEFACSQIIAQVQYKPRNANTTLGDGGLAFEGINPAKLLTTGIPTSKDTNAALRFARKEFAANKIPSAALKAIQLNRIRNVDLNGDGDLETISTFETSHTRYSKAHKTELTFIYFLAQIIDDGHVTYTSYAYGDEGAYESDGATRSDVAGVSDLDGDGIAEIILRNFYYESHDYSVIKKRNGRWLRVWQGGGGGC
jgi:hypothetical protein